MNLHYEWSTSFLHDFKVFIIGCGLSGSVIAQKIVENFDCKVLIIEKRNHIGGYNHFLGASLFHTNMAHVWEYVNRFEEFVRWDHQVVASVDGKLVPVPVNMITVNTLFNECLQTEEDMSKWLTENQCKFNTKPSNSEEICKSQVGELLYEKLFKPYTFKQWNKFPKELTPEVLSRVSMRCNCDQRYFTDKYQALPKQGYTKLFEKLLTNPNIHVLLNTDFSQCKEDILAVDGNFLVYTGPIDQYYSSLGHDKLEYRSIQFEIERYKNMNYYQKQAVVNYPGLEHPFTRITEYKHFLNQQSPDTIIVKELPTDIGAPCYPVLTAANLELYEKYRKEAAKDTNIVFTGRLASYKYYNMDQAIDNALTTYEKVIRYKIESIVAKNQANSAAVTNVYGSLVDMCSQS